MIGIYQVIPKQFLIWYQLFVTYWKFNQLCFSFFQL